MVHLYQFGPESSTEKNFQGSKVAKKSNFIPSKLLIVEGSLTTQNDRNTQVSIVDLCKFFDLCKSFGQPEVPF